MLTATIFHCSGSAAGHGGCAEALHGRRRRINGAGMPELLATRPAAKAKHSLTILHTFHHPRSSGAKSGVSNGEDSSGNNKPGQEGASNCPSTHSGAPLPVFTLEIWAEKLCKMGVVGRSCRTLQLKLYKQAGTTESNLRKVNPIQGARRARAGFLSLAFCPPS
jgi:hypothetical protein